MPLTPDQVLFGSPPSTTHEPDKGAMRDLFAQIIASVATVYGMVVALDPEAATFHATIAAGRAAVEDGEQYFVQSSDPDIAFYVYERVNGSTSTLLVTWPSVSALGEKADAVHDHSVTDLSDSTAAGRALLTAANAAEQITALGLASVATSGSYNDLADKPMLGSAAAADASAFATAAQGEKADNAIQPSNPALTNAREWTGETVGQAEAEAGTATTRRAWTAQRVRQAAAAWWAASSAKAALDAATAAISALTTRVDRIAISDETRPGENPEQFSADLTGEPEDRTPLSAAGVAIDDDLGAVWVQVGAGIVAPRRAFAVEDDRVYRLRVLYKRTVDSLDPSGDAVLTRIRNLTKNKATVSTATLHTAANPVSPNLIEVSVIISKDPEVEGVGYVPPATTRYVTPFGQTFGDTPSTAFSAFEWSDITDVVLGGADVASLASGLAAETLARQSDVADLQQDIAEEANERIDGDAVNVANLAAHEGEMRNPHRTSAAQLGVPQVRAFDGRPYSVSWSFGWIDEQNKLLFAGDDWSNLRVGVVELLYSEENSLGLIGGWLDVNDKVLFAPDRDGGFWAGGVYVGQSAANSLNAVWLITDINNGTPLWVDNVGRVRAALEDSIVYVAGGDVFEVAGVNVNQLTARGDVTHAENIGDGRFKFVATRGGAPILLEAHKATPTQVRVHYECRRKNEFLGITGQSLAVGPYTVLSSTPVYPENALCFVEGPVGRQDEVTGPEVVPLIEDFSETIASGMARTLLDDTLDRVLLMGGQAWEGKPYAELQKGHANGVYEAILYQMRLAAAQPGGAHMRAVCVIHGETDGLIGNTEYDDDLIEWLDDFDADAAEIFGQRDGLVMLLCQTSSIAGYADTTAERDAFTSPLLQAAAANAHPRIFCVGPKYQYTYNDHAHIDAASTRKLGVLYAKVYRRVVIEGLDWKPVQPNDFTVDGSDIVIDFDVPVGPLVLDTTLVTDPGDYGFNLLDAGGATITGVALTGAAQVTVTLSAPPTTGWRLSYAIHNGTHGTSGATTGSRGCIRDSDPYISPYDGLPDHNWSIVFQHTF